MPAPQENERAARAERLPQSLLEGAPDISLLAPGFIYEQHFGNTEGTYRGEEGLERWIETFYEVWDRASMTVEGVREAGDRLALDVLVEVRARQTGIEVEMRATQVFEFSADGLITRMDAFNEPDGAEQALHGRPAP
jgi:ketosteroid isomerase-like protein